MQDANCTHGKDEEIPYQAGDGYIVGEHLYERNLKGLHPLNEEIRSPQGMWVFAETDAQKVQSLTLDPGFVTVQASLTLSPYVH